MRGVQQLPKGQNMLRKPHSASQSVTINSLKRELCNVVIAPPSHRYRGIYSPLAQTEEEENHHLDLVAAVQLWIHYYLVCHLKSCFYSALRVSSRIYLLIIPPHLTILPLTNIVRLFSLLWLTSMAFAARN